MEEHQLKASENALVTTKGCGKPHTCNGTPSNMKIEGECWKCGKKGHKKADCCSKAKDKDKKEEDKKGTRSANAAVEEARGTPGHKDW